MARQRFNLEDTNPEHHTVIKGGWEKTVKVLQALRAVSTDEQTNNAITAVISLGAEVHATLPEIIAVVKEKIKKLRKKNR